MQSQDPLINNSEEICPSCGDLAILVDVTGWCSECSGITPPTTCGRCGGFVEENSRSKLCNSCRYMSWLERNADQIELVMTCVGVSVSKAKAIVRKNNRPICHCCGNPIKGGQKDRNYFCSKTRACKTGQYSYHHYRARGFKDVNALQRAMLAAHKERLIAEAEMKHAAAGQRSIGNQAA